MEDISGASVVSTAPKRYSALLNQSLGTFFTFKLTKNLFFPPPSSSLDDIIKQNRNQRRNEKKNKLVGGNKRVNKNQLNKNKGNKGNMMMDTTPIRNNQNQKNNYKNKNVQKQRGQSRSSKLIVRSNSGRPNLSDRNQKRSPAAASSTPGLRQPWEKLPTAPLPAEPLKISIRNELAERPARMSAMMVDTEEQSYRPAAAYEPRDSLASRDEYRIGNRFSTQGMAIDYQLPSGASYDTRPTRRY